MPRRTRDYAAEYARRNLEARRSGFTSYWQLRQASARPDVQRTLRESGGDKLKGWARHFRPVVRWLPFQQHEHFCPVCGLVDESCTGRFVVYNYNPLGCENGSRLLQCAECHASILQELADDRLRRLRNGAPA